MHTPTRQATTVPAIAEATCNVMGTWAHIVVNGGRPGLAWKGVDRLMELEQRWSRFVGSSEISLLNRSAGERRRVSADTVCLLDRMLRANRMTRGRYDPTVHDALVGLGYDRSFRLMHRVTGGRHDAPPRPAPGMSGAEIDHDLSTVMLPSGVHIDAGGIGKGLAADMIATETIGLGAAGVLVNVGGDLRVIGDAPGDSVWRIDVDHPTDGSRRIAQAILPGAGSGSALATSSRMKRAWSTDGSTRHHLIDPRTGAPADRPWAMVSVICDHAWRAEALTKAAFLDGSLDPNLGARTLLADPDGLAELDGHHAERSFLLTSDHC